MTTRPTPSPGDPLSPHSSRAAKEHVSLAAVLLTGAAVLVLWIVSFALSYAPLGATALPVALVIAAAKAALVALFFMELARSTLSLKLTILSAITLLVILIGFMVGDVATRGRPPLIVPGGGGGGTAPLQRP